MPRRLAELRVAGHAVHRSAGAGPGLWLRRAVGPGGRRRGRRVLRAQVVVHVVQVVGEHHVGVDAGRVQRAARVAARPHACLDAPQPPQNTALEYAGRDYDRGPTPIAQK